MGQEMPHSAVEMAVPRASTLPCVWNLTHSVSLDTSSKQVSLAQHQRLLLLIDLIFCAYNRVRARPFVQSVPTVNHDFIFHYDFSKTVIPNFVCSLSYLVCIALKLDGTCTLIAFCSRRGLATTLAHVVSSRLRVVFCHARWLSDGSHGSVEKIVVLH